MPPAIRPAQSSDADAVFALLRRFAIAYPPNRAHFDQNFPKLLADENVVLRVIESEGEVAGYVLAFVLHTLFTNKPILELQEIVVGHDYRKRGLGKMLLEEVVRHADAIDCAEVTVPTSRRQEFYIQMGFAESASYLRKRLEKGAP